MINFDSFLSRNANKPKVCGDWYTVQWCPDLATAERLNIGVCFVDSYGKSFVQTLESYERIKCLYSSGMEHHLRLACTLVEEAIHTGVSVYDIPFSNISIKANGYAQGKSVDDLLASLFSNVVPLSRKVLKKRERTFNHTSRERLYNIMDGWLKDHLEYEEYFNMVSIHPTKSVYLGNSNQNIFLPYQSDRSIATIASASYADATLAKCHLYDAQRDLSLALSNFRDLSDASIFILSPDGELNAQRRDEVDNEIDKFCWYLKTLNVQTEVDSSPESLSEKAAYWYRKKAA